MEFQLPYNRDDYIEFFETQFLPDDFQRTFEDIDIPFQYEGRRIKKVTKLGEVKSLDNLKVYEVEHESEYDPRVSLSREIFKLMAIHTERKALVLFISPKFKNYRLSLVTIDLIQEEGKLKKEYSNPRRYSFFLGPDAKVYTPKQYLLKKGRLRDLDDLKNRFSIEVVNKEFYQKIAVAFSKLVGGKRKVGSKIEEYKGTLRLPSKDNRDKRAKEFAVRLIGRIIFCWFLKKKLSENDKSLIPEELLSLDAVKKEKEYYHEILEPLFFEALNTPQKERRDEYKQGLYKDIPFLNGGLFEPTNDFYISDDESMEKYRYYNTLKVPGKWLSEFFEILETYNFTIDENTTIDVDLSIDPEMLGRIFENLLAEINPETEESARKATGSYYTPRPIVDYMVDESLKQYLITKTEITEEKITELLSYDEIEVDLTGKENDGVINALDKIKVIDPACGSGAFIIGILNKMVLILQKVDPESREWLESLLNTIDEPSARELMRMKLEDDKDMWDYTRKMGIIRKSIYGIDIQPIAVEIAKLRCYLSLIVDEKVIDEEKNRNIEPLPNLEFKFVCANSLIDVPEEYVEDGTIFGDDFFPRLEKLIKDYFQCWEPDKKKDMHKRIEELIDERVDEKLKSLNLGIGFDKKHDHITQKNTRKQ